MRIKESSFTFHCSKNNLENRFRSLYLNYFKELTSDNLKCEQNKFLPVLWLAFVEDICDKKSFFLCFSLGCEVRESVTARMSKNIVETSLVGATTTLGALGA